ncbi:probable ATP-dependent RNA helicase DHX35 isoform X1 [Xenia sp. Carnegie-2017]|uniref:probable ATP-dependent RNA helicase DHX35 isoform X1 n=1 Tax=Xenia sp. Carnegie-2017 TaxID=2897299 RepID=UPI001F045483|nr:probable ATP-dependent RNA helicase DHX35 isoform X1 [Xenia sp. Carnegie-2017]
MAAGGMRLQFWKPGTEAPSIQHERTDKDGEEAGVVAFPSDVVSSSIARLRQRLPVFKHRTNILYLVEKYQTVIIVGETGCGKSTQIPQYLFESGLASHGKVIGVTQPRRVAATSVAMRVAEERGTMIGQEVGYHIRFDDCTDPQKTAIKFVTDGMLIREMMADPLLTKYSVIMLDEVHERTLYTDVILGLLKKIQKKRKDLKLIVTSATMDAEMFRDFFNTNISKDKSKDTAAILSVEGRTFPTEIYYVLSPVADYIKASVDAVIGIHLEQEPGDVLVFLTGQDEVESAVSMIIEKARTLPKGHGFLKVLPIYSGLSHAEQMRIFERSKPKERKVVVATNIAETSLTIDGIVYVVDCGFVKIKTYSVDTGLESLVVVPASQASADQRAGRAGRVRSGKAYRLYTEDAFHNLSPAGIPEMQRTNLAPVILQLKSMGIDNVLRFDFLARPPAEHMIRALELLYALEALDDDGCLTTPLGVNMAEFPLEPNLAKMLLVSGEFGCSEEILTIAAILQIKNVFVTPSNEKRASARAKLKFSVYEGDHLTLLNVYQSFLQHKKNSKWCHENFLNYKGLCHAIKIREQLKRLIKSFGVALRSVEDDPTPILRCIVKGFFANAARLHADGTYRSIRENHPLYIHPTSVLYTEKPPQWIVYHELQQTSKEFMRDITVIQSSWLYELAPHYYEYGTARELAAKRAKHE